MGECGTEWIRGFVPTSPEPESRPTRADGALFIAYLREVAGVGS